MKIIRVFLMCLWLLVVLSGCTSNNNEPTAGNKKELLIFCGITMIDPIMELSDLFEKKYNAAVKMSYGGSQDLAKSIEVNKVGDIYFPGMKKFVERMDDKDLITGATQVGYNQVAFFVQKGNPRKLTGSLDNLTDPSLAVAIGHEALGSVGGETRRILMEKGNYQEVIKNVAMMASDSKGMTSALREKQVDLVLNWRSVRFFKDNDQFIEEVLIEPGYAIEHPLVIASLKYSKFPYLAELFLNLCASKEGQHIFRKYGFQQ